MSEQPRPFKDMPGLLKFCIESTKDDDPTNLGSEFEPMSEEKKEWLENALFSMTEDTIKLMRNCIETLKKGGDNEEALQEQEDALDQLLERCDNIDYAMDFHKIGGYDILVDLLNSCHSSIQWRTAYLLAELSQNNPYCQERALEFQLLPVLLDLLDKSLNEDVRIKALYAVSCLTRDNESLLKVFLEFDGFSILMRAMQAEIEKLKIKASFMLNAVCSRYPSFKGVVCDMGYLEQLIALIHREHEPSHEQLLGAILTIITDHPRAIKECQRSEFCLKDILQNRIKFLSDNDEFTEEKEYCQEIMNLCFKDEDFNQTLNAEMER